MPLPAGGTALTNTGSRVAAIDAERASFSSSLAGIQQVHSSFSDGWIANSGSLLASAFLGGYAILLRA